MFYVLSVILAILLVTFHVVTRHSRSGELLMKIPGPIPFPIFGNTLSFLMNCPNEFWEKVRRISKEYYPITRFWYFTTAVISTRHPDDLELLFTSQKVIQKGYLYAYLHVWLKNGLLTSTGDLWRHRRKILTPAFHFNILKKYLETTSEEGRRAVADLKSAGNESIYNVEDFCSKYTLNIICESALGVNLRTIDEKIVNEYRESIHNMGRIVRFRTPRPYFYNWMMPYVYKWGKLQSDCIKSLHSLSKKLIDERIAYHKSTSNKYLADEVESTGNTYDGTRKRPAMLDLLLTVKEKGQIDLEGVQEEVDTFMFEGHDTTGMALTYTMFLLAGCEAEQEKCREEVNKLLDRTDGNPQMSDLQELSYLERCIKEALRMFPPVPTLIRYTPEDFQLKHALVPAKSHIVIHLYDVHRDPNFWTEPDKFDPDRFLPENSINRHPYAYVPFSAGSRNCIGQKFAMIEMKLFLARVLYDFRLESVAPMSDMKLSADIVLRPLKPIRIKFIRIKK